MRALFEWSLNWNVIKAQNESNSKGKHLRYKCNSSFYLQIFLVIHDILKLG